MTDTKDLLRAIDRIRVIAKQNLITDEDELNDEEPWNHDESSMDTLNRGEARGAHVVALEILEILGEDDDE